MKTNSKSDLRNEAEPICGCVHTPGPWDVNEPDSKGGVWVDAPDGLTVARVGGGVSSVAEAIANARLIASAPALLAALAGCADALREAGKDLARANPHAARPNIYELHEQAARAAIAKARG